VALTGKPLCQKTHCRGHVAAAAQATACGGAVLGEALDGGHPGRAAWTARSGRPARSPVQQQRGRPHTPCCSPGACVRPRAGRAAVGKAQPGSTECSRACALTTIDIVKRPRRDQPGRASVQRPAAAPNPGQPSAYSGSSENSSRPSTRRDARSQRRAAAAPVAPRAPRPGNSSAVSPAGPQPGTHAHTSRAHSTETTAAAPAHSEVDRAAGQLAETQPCTGRGRGTRDPGQQLVGAAARRLVGHENFAPSGGPAAHADGARNPGSRWRRG